MDSTVLFFLGVLLGMKTLDYLDCGEAPAEFWAAAKPKAQQVQMVQPWRETTERIMLRGKQMKVKSIKRVEVVGALA